MANIELKLPIPASDLVPHRESMLLIQSLDEYAEDFASAQFTVLENNIFVNKNGQLDPIVYVELLAQLVAAHSGFEAIVKQKLPKTGFLVGIKDFKSYTKVQTDDKLILSIIKDYTFDQISYLSGEIKKENKLVASGILKVWEQPGEQNTKLEYKDQNSQILPVKIKNKWSDLADKMLLNEQILKSITEINQNENQSNVSLIFNKDFTGFRGHFPDMPILPGVIMLKTGMLLGEMLSGHGLIPINIKQAKFAKSVFPGEIIKVNTNLKTDNDNIKLSILIIRNDETCAKFSINSIKQ